MRVNDPIDRFTFAQKASNTEKTFEWHKNVIFDLPEHQNYVVAEEALLVIRFLVVDLPSSSVEIKKEKTIKKSSQKKKYCILCFLLSIEREQVPEQEKHP